MKFWLSTLLTLSALLFSAGLRAQEVAPQDSIVAVTIVRVDSTLVGRSVMDLLPSGISVHQSQATLSALNTHVGRNSSRKDTGYRVRIYFDNQQNSRAMSQAAMTRFSASYPSIPAYWSYQAPFFKVTVGDYRTKSEAMELLRAIKESFPTAFVVKEQISYPAAKREHLNQ